MACLPILRGSRRPGRGLAVGTLVAFLCGTGCLSHEYRISRTELRHLAELPPEARGQRVRVVQRIGERRAPAVGPEMAMRSELDPADYDLEPAHYPAYDTHLTVGAELHGSIGLHGPVSQHRLPRGTRVAPPVPGASGARPGQPTEMPTGPSPARTVARGRGGGSVGGGRGIPLPSTSGKAEELVVVAIVVAAVAVLSMTGLAVTEGLRFDGDVAAAPGQLVYLRDQHGGERAVPLYALSPADAGEAHEALLRDDEGWGLARLNRAALDRRGFAFKLDAGLSDVSLDRYRLWGLASHVQLGYFPHHRFGLLASGVLAGGEEQTGAVVRYGIGLEAQVFPLAVGPVHLGGFAHGGLAVGAAPDITAISGPAFGGGAMLELELTTRLAMTLRADWSRASLGSVSRTGTTFTVGLAVY